MKPTIINNHLAEEWLINSHHYLVDRPLSGMLHNSLFSSLNQFGFFHNNFLETPEGYKVEVAVPGMCKTDLRLEVENNILVVQGRKEQKEKSGWFNKTAEYRSTQIYKTLMLPEDADVNGIRAKCKNGVLKISIPKVNQQSKRKLIPVNVAGKPEANWWEKLTRPIKSFWDKVSGKSKQLVPGF